MSRQLSWPHLFAFCILLMFGSTVPLFAQTGSCNVIPGVVASWPPGQAPPPAWQAADPNVLTDGNTSEAWYYYWSTSGMPMPTIFTIPAGYDITGVRWHDHNGGGNVLLEANGQSLTFTTDLWPHDWHEEPWTLSGVTSVSFTTSLNDTKISELSFCGSQGTATTDTTPPEVVGNLQITKTCTSIDVSWSASQDFDDSSNPSGLADQYLISWDGQPDVAVSGLSYSIPAAPSSSYAIRLIAVDTAGNASPAVTVNEATPACPTGGGCVTIPGVTADWPPGSPPPEPWISPSPSLLVDGLVDDEWFYYWQPGPALPMIFTLPPGSNISAVRWHDHNGNGDIFLEANGQTTTFSTNHWPHDWHTHPWSVANVSSVAMTTSSNDTKISELTFCTDQGPTDTVPPDAVDDLVATVPGCTSASLTWSAPTDYDDNGPNGTASSYQISVGTNPPITVTASPVTVSGLAPDSSHSITITAFDAAGNASLPTTITVVTPACPSGGPDPHPATEHIIDSFGEQVVPVATGHPWHAIQEYYNDYYDDDTHNWSDDEMCSIEIHNSYWVLADENGQTPGSGDYDGDGDYETYYPTWHPPIHDEFGPDRCYFMHDHGEDPRTSPFYDLDDALSIGVPFGYVHSKLGNTNGRLEDHVGHKVVVENDFTLVTGNPYNPGSNFDEDGDNCNWLSKIHQGSHSSDALGNNLHEYFLNFACDDSPMTHVRIKELVTWGYPHRVFNEGSGACSPPPGIQWFWAGYPAVDPVHSPQNDNLPGGGPDPNVPPGAVTGPFQDGKREFACLANRHEAFYNAGAHAGQPQTLAELWKPDGEIRAPDGSGSVIFSPYYVTRNPTRYVEPNWVTRFDNYVHDTYLGFSCDGLDSNGIPDDDCQSHQDCVDQNSGRHDGCEGTGAMVSSVDLCVRGSDAWQYSILAMHPLYATNGKYPGFCDLLDSDQRTVWEQEIVAAGGDTLALSESRKYHPENPFDGTLRGVHPKTIFVYQDASPDPNYIGLKVFCTDAFGDSPTWPDLTNPDQPVCPADKILQGISPETNTLSYSEGSSVGATDSLGNPQDPSDDLELGLVAPGEAAEFVIDGVGDGANQVRPPN